MPPVRMKLSVSETGTLEYKGAVKVAMVERMARVKKPLCESNTLENISAMITVEKMDNSMELAVP